MYQKPPLNRTSDVLLMEMTILDLCNQLFVISSDVSNELYTRLRMALCWSDIAQLHSNSSGTSN